MRSGPGDPPPAGGIGWAATCEVTNTAVPTLTHTLRRILTSFSELAGRGRRQSELVDEPQPSLVPLEVRQVEVAIRLILGPPRDLDRVGGLENGIRQDASRQGRTDEQGVAFLL